MFGQDVEEIQIKAQKLVKDHIKSYHDLFPQTTSPQMISLNSLLMSAYTQGYLRAAYDITYEKNKNA